MIGKLEGLHRGSDYILSSGGLRDHTRKFFVLRGLRYLTREEVNLYDREA